MLNTLSQISEDAPGRMTFEGSDTARLFTREIEESLAGVLAKNYVCGPETEDAGFVSASVDGRPWTDTMWSRDAGVFLRELVHWGYLGRACLTADCLIRLVRENDEGFHTFPEYFRPGEPGCGEELDGTMAVVIGMVLLWRRLAAGHPMRERLYAFLHGPGSPLRYVDKALQEKPLLAGTGEFGGGCEVPGRFANVVQNNLAYFALQAAAEMEQSAGDFETARLHRETADALWQGIRRYLVDPGGAWTWCVDPETLRPVPSVLNKGGSAVNGPGCMSADVLGFEPAGSGWDGVGICARTLDAQAAAPRRKEQFDRHGLWTEYDEDDEYFGGYGTGLAYGHAYATQTMLLYDRLRDAARAIDFLAKATHRPPRRFPITRESPYWFYEQYQSPDTPEGVAWSEGCGALNLVGVAECLKIARLLLGVDDTSRDRVVVVPRVPDGWSGYEAVDWPILAGDSLKRAHMTYKHVGRRVRFRLRVTSGGRIPNLVVKLGRPPGRKAWDAAGVEEMNLETQQ